SAEIGGGCLENQRSERSLACNDHSARRPVHPDKESSEGGKYGSDADCDSQRILASARECAKRDYRRGHGRGNSLDGAGGSRKVGPMVEAVGYTRRRRAELIYVSTRTSTQIEEIARPFERQAGSSRTVRQR